MAVCVAPGCEVAAGKRSTYCRVHYNDVRVDKLEKLQSRQGKVKHRLEPGEVGRWCVNRDGYVVRVRRLANGDRIREYQHRFVMSEALGRELLEHELPRHKNGIRYDNRPENLELLSTLRPPGQRVEDQVVWAKALLSIYDPEALA